MSESIKSWREEYDRRGAEARAVEAKAIEMGLPEGFTVSLGRPRVSWSDDAYANQAEGDTRTDMQRFIARVKQVTALLEATPDTSTSGGSATAAPNLHAEWEVPFESTAGGFPWHTLKVCIDSWQPADCKLHPDNRYKPSSWTSGEDADIHPECAAMLLELEDMDIQ